MTYYCKFSLNVFFNTLKVQNIVMTFLLILIELDVALKVDLLTLLNK